MPKGISLRTRRQVLTLYFQGLPYDQIARRTMLSTGSVANIVREAREGKFKELKDLSEQIDGLRELSAELRKKNLTVSQALLGLSFYERLSQLGIEPIVLGSWIKMCHEVSSSDYPIQEFMAAALRLKELEHQKGMTYEDLVEACEAKGKALTEIESRSRELETSRKTLKGEIHGLNEEKGSLETKVRELHTEKKLLSERVKKWKQEGEDLRNTVFEVQKRLTAFKQECQRLEDRAVALREETGERESILSRLRSLGFGEGELLRLKDKLEELVSNGNVKPAELRENLFLDLDGYASVLSFRNEAAKLRAEVKSLRGQKKALTEENENLRQAIKELEKVSGEAVLNIKKEERQIIASMGNLFTEAGEALGQSISEAKLGVNKLQSDIESSRQEVKTELGRAISEAIEYGKAMARMEKVVGEREELVRLFRILGDVSTVPKDMAVKAPLVVLGKFREWVEKNHGLRNERKVLSSVEEIVGLLTVEAT
jgi:DNA repair exonuclease SbcCD ATPase subunit